MAGCEKITWLGVAGQHQKEAASSSNQVDAQTGRQQNSREEEEIAVQVQELLLLPPQLQVLGIRDCPELRLLPDSLDEGTAAGQTARGGGGGLQALCSLRALYIQCCPKLLSSFLSSSQVPCCFPFPTSVQHLTLDGGVVGMETLAPLSNLASLTGLLILGCGDLRGEGLWRLLAQGCLAELQIYNNTPNFFAASDSEPSQSQQHQQGISSRSSELKFLRTDDAGVLAAPLCSLLSSSLARLICVEAEVERFSKGQEEALQLLTSLQELYFWKCGKLECLPAGLHRLTNLKSLDIQGCAAIRSLPKDGLPNSLQKLMIWGCPAIRSLPKDGLPNSLQDLHIIRCKAIRSLPKGCLPNSLQQLHISSCPLIHSLPKGCLPSSLRELYVSDQNSEELRRQCRKLIGTIPIVRTGD